MQQGLGRKAVLVLSVAVAMSAAPIAAQTNFTSYVALGDAFTAGFSNGSLVEAHQRRSYPALLARQAGVSGFEQPLVSDPGIPTELTLVSLVPPVVAAKAATQGAPLRRDLARPYNNLGVPAATVGDLLTRVTDGAQGSGFHDLVLRGSGTALDQGLSLRPTTLTLWIGTADVMAAVVNGRAVEGATMTPVAAFRAAFQSVVNAVKASGAFVVVANVPDVTAFPYATTLRPIVVNPSTGAPVLVNGQVVPLLGPDGPLPSNSLVTLAASPLLLRGDGIPTAAGGSGRPLPDGAILDLAEAAAIRERVAQLNLAIAEICQAASIPVLDLSAFFAGLAAGGRVVAGITLTSSFLTGGLFGYDGLHPTDLGYALVAREWIALINARGGQLPDIDLGPYLGVAAGATASARSAERTSGWAPWTAFTADAYAALKAAYPRLDRK
jgi:lysophospholipase L1-like esterase